MSEQVALTSEQVALASEQVALVSEQVAVASVVLTWCGNVTTGHPGCVMVLWRLGLNVAYEPLTATAIHGWICSTYT